MNANDCRYLSQESLKEEIFSSNTHSVGLLSDEIKQMPSGMEYEIPHRYHMDMLVFLPINLDTSFVYWEVTPSLLSKYHATLDRLKAKVYSLDETQEEELVEFQVSTELGKYYLHFKAAMKRVQARMGFYNDAGEFIIILHSNVFRMANDRIEFSEDEVWMSINESTREIIRASLHNEPGVHSSKGLSEERLIERSKTYGISSSYLTQRGQ